MVDPLRTRGRPRGRKDAEPRQRRCEIAAHKAAKANRKAEEERLKSCGWARMDMRGLV